MPVYPGARTIPAPLPSQDSSHPRQFSTRPRVASPPASGRRSSLCPSAGLRCSFAREALVFLASCLDSPFKKRHHGLFNSRTLKRLTLKSRVTSRHAACRWQNGQNGQNRRVQWVADSKKHAKRPPRNCLHNYAKS